MKFDPHLIRRHSNTTKASHLRRMREMEDAAWEEFYGKYRSMIAAVGKKHGLAPGDCDDLMQQVTAVMCERLRTFVYEPEKCRFRSFLYRVAANLSYNIRRKKRKAAAALPATPDYTEPDIDLAFMKEYENYLLGRSFELLKRSMESGVYLAFEMLVVEERPVAEVAALTGKTAGALYNIRHRGLKKLRGIITEFERIFAGHSGAELGAADPRRSG